MRIIKHRLDGRTGTFDLRYNTETGRHEEIGGAVTLPTVAEVFAEVQEAPSALKVKRKSLRKGTTADFGGVL